MSQLDHHRTLERFDPVNIAHAAERLPDQLRYGWEHAEEVVLPAAYRKTKEVVMCGMGGSALGAALATSALYQSVKIPLIACQDYALPTHVGAHTLVIIISMSGTTEEMLAAYEDARAKKAKIIVLTGGGTLEKLAKKHHHPLVAFDCTEYADQRYATGILAGALLRILTRVGVASVKNADLERAMRASHDVIDTCAPDIPTAENPAKQIAEALHNQHVLVLAAEHLQGNAHAIANALNETAKQQAHWHALPEFNHHYLEALALPENSAEKTAVLILSSQQYRARIQDRCAITADLVEGTGATVVEYATGGETVLEEIAEVLTVGYYVSWYTAVLHQCETDAMPFVTALKNALAKGDTH